MEDLKDKTLSDFDKIQSEDDRCRLLLGYQNKSKQWLEDIGRRGKKGRWLLNILSFRPQHKEMRDIMSYPRIKTYLNYAKIKTMIPEIADKWPTMQAMPERDEDNDHTDQVQAYLENMLADANFDSVGLDVVVRGIVVESALASFEKSLDPKTGKVSGTFSQEDVFSHFPSPNFLNDGMDLVAGDALFQSFIKPINCEAVKDRWGVDVAMDDVREYSTAGMLDLYSATDNASGLFRQFYWMSKFDPAAVKNGFYNGTDMQPGQSYLRGVWFVRLKERGNNSTDNARWKIVKDFEVDRTTEHGTAHIPFFRFVSDLDALTGFGTAVSELGSQNQKELDNLLSNAAFVQKRYAFPIVLGDKDEQMNQDESIMARIAACLPLWESKRGSIRFEAPPTGNPMALPLAERIEAATNTAFGVYESMAGDQKFANMPMGTTLALMEAAGKRVRLIIDTDVSRWQKPIGQYLLKMIKDSDALVPADGVGVKGSGKGAQAMQYMPKEGAGPFLVNIVVGAGLPKGRLATEARIRELAGNPSVLTPLEVIDNLVDGDSEKRKAAYLEYQGVLQHMQMMQAEQQAQVDFQQKVIQMMELLNNPEFIQTGQMNTADTAKYGMLLDDVWELLDQFPAIISTDKRPKEFGQLPVQVQTQILSKFIQQPNPDNAPPALPQPAAVQARAQEAAV